MNEHLWVYTDEEWEQRLAGFSLAEIGWAAGFFDGEGCITAGRKKRPSNRHAWFSVRVIVSNTSLEALERFQAIFRGTVYARPLIEGRRQQYELHLDGKSCERCLATLLPHLTVKRVQGEAALAMRAILTQHDPRRKGGVPSAVYDQLAELVDVIRSANGRNYRIPVPVSRGYVEV